MNACLLTVLSAATLAASSAASAAIDIHVTGSDWGIWVTGLFTESPADNGATHYALADDGSGNPMDLMLGLTDGTSLDGSDISSRMITADVAGNVGDDTLDLSSWSAWLTVGDFGIHVIWDAIDAPLALDNLGSSGKDGVRYAASGFDETLVWTLERADGSVETFTTDFNSFEFVAPVPAPGAAALFGLAGLTASRRRRA